MKKDEKTQKIKLIKGMMKEYGITLKDLKEDDIVGFDANKSLISGMRGYAEAFHNMISFGKDAEEVKMEIQMTKFDGKTIASLLNVMYFKGRVVWNNWTVVAETSNYLKLKAFDPFGNAKYMKLERREGKL